MPVLNVSRLWISLVVLGTIFVWTATSSISSFLKVRAEFFAGQGTTNFEAVDDIGRVIGNNEWLSKSSSSILGGLRQHSVTEIFLFVSLAVQCGTHPILVKLYMPFTVNRSTVILSQEMIKLLISLVMLTIHGSFQEVFQTWSLHGAILAAGVPASLFVVQNYCNLMANQTLPPVTFVLLNQTKIISTAWCCFLLLGQIQSQLQVMALLLLVLSTLLLQRVIPLRPCLPCCDCDDKLTDRCACDLEKQQEGLRDHSILSTESQQAKVEISILDQIADSSSSSDASEGVDDDQSSKFLLMGVLPALTASFLSGLAGAITQKTLQVHRRDPYLFNMELSFFSSIFIVASFAIIRPSRSTEFTQTTITANDSENCRVRKNCLLVEGWTYQTWIPVMTNAVGAILVGLVTKYSGAVTKGFAIIIGIMISAVLNQAVVRDAEGSGGLSREELAGGFLGVTSMLIHLTNPPIE